MENSFDAIIFDLGGVVLNLDYEATINAFKELGKENFDKLYTQANQDKIFDQYETGSLSTEDFRNYFRQFLDDEISDQQINDAWNSLLLDLPQNRIDLLFKLKNKYQIFLLSNTNELHLKQFRIILSESYGDADLLEKVFHKTYYSNLIGKRKPNADAFELLIDEQGLETKKTLFIDDSIQHIEGAKKIGLQTIHLTEKDITDIF